jgi:hypothetical protein
VAVAGGLAGFGLSPPCAFDDTAVNKNRLIILNTNKRFIVNSFCSKKII